MTREQESLVAHVRDLCNDAQRPDHTPNAALTASYFRAGVLQAARACNAPAEVVTALEQIPDPMTE